MRDFLELFATDELSEEVLAAASATDDGQLPASTITDEDVSRLDAVLKAEVGSQKDQDAVHVQQQMQLGFRWSDEALGP